MTMGSNNVNIIEATDIVRSMSSLICHLECLFPVVDVLHSSMLPLACGLITSKISFILLYQISSIL